MAASSSTFDRRARSRRPTEFSSTITAGRRVVGRGLGGVGLVGRRLGLGVVLASSARRTAVTSRSMPASTPAPPCEPMWTLTIAAPKRRARPKLGGQQRRPTLVVRRIGCRRG